MHRNINNIIKNIHHQNVQSKALKITRNKKNTPTNVQIVQKWHSMLEEVNLKTFTTKKGTKTPDLTPLTDKHETCKENPVTDSHESSLYFWHQKTEQELFFSVQWTKALHCCQIWTVLNFTCVTPSWIHIEIIPGLYILTSRWVPDPSFKAPRRFWRYAAQTAQFILASTPDTLPDSVTI